MEKIFNYKYLSKNHIRGFDSYKYSSIDTSPLSNYVMHPLWDASVKLIPKWVAPNVMTFAGFLLVVATAALVAAYDYGCHGPIQDGTQVIPDWVFTACAVFIFLAYNLDGMDGKQARRIGVSGPLGELFDHGLDSNVVFLIPYALFNVFGRDHEYTVSLLRALLMKISVCLNFYVTYWDQYNTGTVHLPWGYDVSMWCSTLLYLMQGLYGPRVFYTDVLGFKFVQILEVAIHVTGLCSTLPIAAYNTYLAKKNRKSVYKSLLDMIRPIWSIFLISAAILVWAVKSPNDILEYDPKAFVLIYGIAFSNVAARLIVAGMGKQKCDVIGWMCWPLLAGVAISLYLPNLEIAAMYTVLLLSIVGHMHYGICVVRQICNHFKINCFIVPRSKWQ